MQLNCCYKTFITVRGPLARTGTLLRALPTERVQYRHHRYHRRYRCRCRYLDRFNCAGIVLALASYLYRKRYALLMCVHELVITGGMSSPAANVSVTSVRVIRAGEESVSTA